MAENETPTPNQNQIDQYQLVNCIATGGISQIWEVKHISNQQQYAMKLLLPEHLKDKELKNELKTEAMIAKELEHPHIIKIMETSIGRDNCYFIMEHFRGGNLKGMIRGDMFNAQVRAQKIMEACTGAFAYIHDKGWVHKDIKPDNVLVTKGGDLRIIDFSLAAKPTGLLSKLLTLKSSVRIQGTRTYLAPELIQRLPLTFSADIYSLGIMFFELLVGRAPFIMSNPNDLLVAHVRDTPDKPSSYNINLTTELDQFIMKMIAKKPKDRFASMHDVANALRSLKVFKENPESYLKNKAKEDEARFLNSMAHSMDSRTDAGRTPEERKAAADEAAKTKAMFKGKRDEAKIRVEGDKSAKAGSKPTAPAPQPAMQQPMMQQQPMMGMPQMQMPMGYPGGYPGMPMPGMYPGGMPGMMMPGQMPGMMPGQAMPGYLGGQMPGMPQSGMMPGAMPSGMPMPGMPQAPAAPRPVSAAPVAPLPVPIAPKPMAPKPVAPKPVDDIPMMTMDELPDVT